MRRLGFLLALLLLGLLLPGPAAATTITLSGTSISVAGTGVSVQGTVATVTASGTYVVSGTLSDGQLVVAASSVVLSLSGASIKCSTGSPVLVNQSSGSTTVSLASGSINTLSDGFEYANPDDDPNAALFSKNSLTISGPGKLIVYGNYQDGITSKDGLVVNGGAVINVIAVDDAVRGKDYLLVQGNETVIEALAGTGVGLKSDNSASGQVTVQDGTIIIDAGSHAIEASTGVIVQGGILTLSAQGSGIYGTSSVTVDGGVFEIESNDHGIHSPGTVSINDGSFEIITGDDGLHGTGMVEITGGYVNIISCIEGIEGQIVDISGGTVRIKSSDDGINCASDSAENNYFYLAGNGYIYIDSTGDGVDSNGNMEMSGGTLIIHGPTTSECGALDYDIDFAMNSGTMIGSASCGIAETASEASSQNAILVALSSVQSAHTLFHLQSSSGTNIVTFSPTKEWQTMAFSSSGLVKGTSYAVYYGGTCTGSPTDGLYPSSCVYSSGTKFTTFTLSSTITVLGTNCVPQFAY
ncbi:dockerin type 1 [Pelomyxa schiedti]|nr:dockerin type 1 [Pelomyxa schiedti]